MRISTERSFIVSRTDDVESFANNLARFNDVNKVSFATRSWFG